MSVETVRADWERGFAALEKQKSEPRRYARLLGAVEAVTAELRARVGQTFTLDQLADAYSDAERWAREAVSEHAPYDGWPRDLVLVQDAAFHLYARGALDFAP
jgi:chorismate-pyruvate lyase